MKKQKIDKPYFNKFRYYFINIIIYILGKLLIGFTIIKKDYRSIKKAGASIILCNHTSNADIGSISTILYPRRMTFVTAEKLKYEAPLIRWIASDKTMISKKQFAVDVQSVRNIIRYLKAGVNVLIFPEGKISADGVNSYIAPAIVKLIQLVKVPVLSCKIEGGYLVMPRWIKGLRIRKTYPKVTLETLFSREDIANYSQEKLYNRIVDRLSYNDNIYQLENKIRIKKKNRAEYLHGILYKCPKCKAEFKMKSEGATLYCTHCDNKVVMSEYGELIPDENSVSLDRIDIWYDFIKQSIRENLLKSDYTYSADVIVTTIDTNYSYSKQKILPLPIKNGEFIELDDNQFYKEGESLAKNNVKKYDRGVLRADKEGISYQGTIDGEQVSLFYSASVYSSYSYIPEEKIEVFEKNRMIYFNTPYAVKFNLLAECAFLLKVEQNEGNIEQEKAV